MRTSRYDGVPRISILPKYMADKGGRGVGCVREVMFERSVNNTIP